MSQLELEVAGTKTINTRRKLKENTLIMKRRGTRDKIAVVGAGPVARFFVRMVMGIAGKLWATRFFDSEEQALVWVREETNTI